MLRFKQLIIFVAVYLLYGDLCRTLTPKSAPTLLPIFSKQSPYLVYYRIRAARLCRRPATVLIYFSLLLALSILLAIVAIFTSSLVSNLRCLARHCVYCACSVCSNWCSVQNICDRALVVRGFSIAREESLLLPLVTESFFSIYRPLENLLLEQRSSAGVFREHISNSMWWAVTTLTYGRLRDMYPNYGWGGRSLRSLFDIRSGLLWLFPPVV